MMPSIAQQLTQTSAALTGVTPGNAALEARVLAAHAWGMTAEELVKHADEPREEAPLLRMVERRMTREPISQIVGVRGFWRDQFRVSADVLTPRPDSETMIEALLRHRPDTQAALRLLDLGTGSGCLLLSALREYPNATGVGVDQSPAALAVAKQNSVSLALDMRCELLHGHWCSNLHGVFDVILSNPPYIPTQTIASLDGDVRDFEPHAALDGGADGLDCYRSILATVRPYLAPHGQLLFEVGMGQAADVAALAEADGFTVLEIANDLAGIARVVILQPQPFTNKE